MNYRTIQIGRPVVNFDHLIDSYRGYDWVSPEILLKAHVTIAYSRTPVDWRHPAFIMQDDFIEVLDGNREICMFDGGAIVLKFSNTLLSNRWSEFVSAGATWDYPAFIPHITLGFGGSIPESAKVFDGPILLGAEYRKEAKSPT